MSDVTPQIFELFTKQMAAGGPYSPVRAFDKVRMPDLAEMKDFVPGVKMRSYMWHCSQDRYDSRDFTVVSLPRLTKLGEWETWVVDCAIEKTGQVVVMYMADMGVVEYDPGKWNVRNYVRLITD